MSQTVHIRTVRETFSPHTGGPVVSGAAVERREARMQRVIEMGYSVTEVSREEDPNQEHLFWPKLCPVCNDNEE